MGSSCLADERKVHALERTRDRPARRPVVCAAVRQPFAGPVQNWRSAPDAASEPDQQPVSQGQALSRRWARVGDYLTPCGSVPERAAADCAGGPCCRQQHGQGQVQLQSQASVGVHSAGRRRRPEWTGQRSAAPPDPRSPAAGAAVSLQRHRGSEWSKPKPAADLATVRAGSDREPDQVREELLQQFRNRLEDRAGRRGAQAQVDPARTRPGVPVLRAPDRGRPAARKKTRRTAASRTPAGPAPPASRGGGSVLRPADRCWPENPVAGCSPDRAPRRPAGRHSPGSPPAETGCRAPAWESWRRSRLGMAGGRDRRQEGEDRFPPRPAASPGASISAAGRPGVDGPAQHRRRARSRTSAARSTPAAARSVRSADRAPPSSIGPSNPTSAWFQWRR
jgi:hypothetical protein